MGAKASISSAALFMLNLIDIVMGLGIMGFCVFCFVHFGDTSLPKGIFIVLLALGGFILLVASLSVIGKACNSRVALFLSKWLGAILALALIASAVGVVCYHEKIEDYVKGLKMEKDVQNRIVEELQSFSPIIGGVLGGLGLLQIFRFLASTMLGSEYAKGAKSPRKDAGEAKLLEKDKAEDDVKQKYSNLRDMYRNKYKKESKKKDLSKESKV